MCRKVFAENSILPQIFRIQHIGIFNKFKFGITLEFAPKKGALICIHRKISRVAEITLKIGDGLDEGILNLITLQAFNGRQERIGITK